MDRDLRLQAAHRRSTGSHHPPCPHPGDGRRQLPPQAEPPKTSLTRLLSALRPAWPPPNSPGQTCLGGGGPLPLRSSAPPPPKTFLLTVYWLPFTPPNWPVSLRP